MHCSWSYSSNFSIQVKSYLILKAPLFGGNRTKISLWNNKFSKWLSLYQNIDFEQSLNDDDSLHIKSVINLETTKMIGKL